MANILNEMNKTLRERFARNKKKYTRWYFAAKTAALRNPPVLKKFPVFEPFGNGARYPAYTFKFTSIWGVRGHGFHRGDDVRTVNVFYPGHELPVQSVENGVVTTSTFSRLWGRHIIIQHGNGLETLYAHNSAVFIKKGQSVEKGLVIALSGKTGNVSGPHIHFAVRANVQGKYYYFAPARVNWKIPVHVGLVNTRGGLTLRKSSRRSAEKIALLPGGAAVLILKRGRMEKIDGRRAPWVKVQYGYEQGWVFSAYLNMTEFKSPTRKKSKGKTAVAGPLAGLRKLRKAELFQLAMSMGIEVDIRMRKAPLLEILTKAVRKAFVAAETSDASLGTNSPADIAVSEIAGITPALEKALVQGRVETAGSLAELEPFRTAMVLRALAGTRV